MEKRMKVVKLLAVLSVASFATAASAQSVGEDVRCLMLSNVFARAAKDDKGREVAVRSALFYLGRINGRSDIRDLPGETRRAGSSIDAKVAGVQMDACVGRLNRAEQDFKAIGNSLAQKKP